VPQNKKNKTKTKQNKTTKIKQNKTKLEIAYNSLTAHPKALEQKKKKKKKANSLKRNRWQEIIKLRAEIDQCKGIHKESIKLGAGSLRESTTTKINP
jgi:hypothetical protein